MRILFLGYIDSPLVRYLATTDEVVATAERVSLEQATTCDFLVSYGYRYILKADTLNRFSARAINLHISYLPWNRGADPNLWSWIEDTPKGVTIHHIDEGIDTGDIIVQKLVAFSGEETLASSYARLHEEMVATFIETWPRIRNGSAPRSVQGAGGSFHSSKDKRRIILRQGWDTPVAELGASSIAVRSIKD